MRESEVQRQILEYLTRRRIPYCRTNAGRVGGVRLAPEGWPDIVAAWEGHFVAIEVKGEGGRVSTDQAVMLAELEEAGAIVIVAWDVRDVEVRLG